jgi:hypothetical protein
LLLLREPVIVYGDSNRRGSPNTIGLLHANYLALADNLGVEPNFVIDRGKLKPEL